MTKIYLDNTKDAQRWQGNNTKEKEKRNANKKWHNCNKQQLGALKRHIGNNLRVLG
jgi:hypothetical protein